jgi:hypothetical protein
MDQTPVRMPRRPVNRGFGGLAWLLALFSASPERALAQGEELRGNVVELSAVVSADVPRVTLHWNAGFYPSTGITVYRRLPGSADWGAGTALAASALTYADATAAAQTLYEYRVVRNQSSPHRPVVEGHLWSGAGIPPLEDRGRLILIVDDTMSTPLAAEIGRLIQDLTGDGWAVARSDVSRTASVVQVRAAIKALYDQDPANSRAVFLLGRVPVPYSGVICPDGHYDPPPEAHSRGAYPADVYYGDMDGVWTDSTVNYTLANIDGARNHNIPGDGKFDQSLIAGDTLPELVVGRVNLANMGGVANGVSETDLLRRYLDRHHEFRHRSGRFATLGERAMVDDNFGDFFGLAFAASGWASGVALFGNGGVSAQPDWVATLRDHDYLLAYGCGPGSPTGAGNVSVSGDFRDTRSRAVFNLLFGSFFGDWDSANNYLRAPLVGTAESHGLISLWSGLPRWQLFPLAAGGTVADAYRHVIFELNQPGGPFPPTDESWSNPDQTHIAIMGDPVLRLQPAKPVTGLSATVDGTGVSLSWTNPAGETGALGCRVYRSDSPTGPFTRIGSQTAPGAMGFADTVPAAGTWHYMVRAIKEQSTASATYENPAQGIFTAVTVATSGFTAWAAGLADGTTSGDPNGDGVPNLLAYAVGAAGGGESAVGRVPGIDTGGGFTIPHSDKDDVRYEVQLSTDLGAWFTVATKPIGGAWALNAASGYPNQANVSLAGSTVPTVTDSTPADRRFWRMKVSQ